MTMELSGGSVSAVTSSPSTSFTSSGSGNGWTSLPVGETCEKIEYYQEVNVLLCYHQPPDGSGARCRIDVLESTTGQTLRSYSLPYPVDHLLTLRKQEKILIARGDLIGFTREVGGCLYLMPCLQLPVSSLLDEVLLELTFDEAKALQPCLTELKTLYYVEENMKQLATDMENQLASSLSGFSQLNDSHDRGSPETTNFVKKMKWISVKLKFQLKQFLDIICAIFNFKVESNGKTKETSSEDCTVMPILFSILNRLAPLHAEAHRTFLKLEERVSKAKQGPHDITSGIHVPGMCSEYARRLTFTTWPHYSYKWAKPDSMAKAGFYHMKGAHNGKDGAQCFKCRISLVKWEASDEPWNEHEQHSPSCLFLKGDPTHNVPIADTVAFSPGVKTTDKKPIEAVSSSNHPFFVATSSKDGSIHIWNCHAVPKLYFNFIIDSSDEQIINVFSSYPEDSSSTTGYSSSKTQMWAGCSPAFFMEEVVSETQDTLESNQMKYENYPQVTFPPEETTGATVSPNLVTVTSLALTGFGGVNPSPFGCLVIVGCLLSDPRSNNSNRPKETCVLIFKVDVSDLRAARHALFNSAPDHTNLLLMDDKFSNFGASEMVTSMPLFSQGITEEMMITDAHEDLINMDIDLPLPEPDFMYYGDDSNSYQEHVDAVKASMFCETSVADPFSSNDCSGCPNKLYNLTDAKLLQAFPIQIGSKVTHILNEQCDNQSFLYVVASKNTASSIYVFQLNRDVASSRFVDSGNPVLQSKHGKILKLNSNHHYTEGVINHVFFLPSWPLHANDLPFSVEKSVSSSFLLCIDSNDNIFLFLLPGLEILYLQTSEKKKLFGDTKIKSASFEWGSDCLSVLTDDGKVHFIELRQLVGDSDESSSLCALGQTPGSSQEAVVLNSSQQSNEAVSSQKKYVGNKFDYLFDHKGQTPELNTATLDWINQISECVALTPRYNVTVIPPGWVEIEQEQQQRKLSEHLPRGGSSAMHTRTFRINKDTMNKALIELSLPFTVVLGHVDLKIQFKKPPPADLTAALYRPCTEYSSKRSGKEKTPTENEKLVGPVNVNIFAFGHNNCSVNVSLSGPNLYLTKHRVILLELFSSNSSLGMNEVSITLRRTKKPQTQRTVAQIRTVLHDPTLVGKLLKAVNSPESVLQVGDTREFYMSHSTIRHTALNVLTWLLYTHAVDNSNSEASNLATFYLACASSDRLVKDLIQTCFINGDRSLAHLFARFVSMLLRFKSMRAESHKLHSDMRKALIELLPSSVLCSSQGGMYWFHLVFHAVVVQGDSEQPSELLISNVTDTEFSSASFSGVFDSCLRLLEYLTNCNEVSQDVFIKTLQSKFRVFCNPFEQRIFTFPIQTIAPNVMKKSNNNNPGAINQTVNKWLMPPIPIPENANANKTAETLHMMFTARRRLSITDEASLGDDMLNKSFVDLFVPFSANSFTMENQLIGFLEAEPLRFTCHESSDGVKLHEMSPNVESGNHSQTLTTEYDDILNEPGMSPTLVQLINLATNPSNQPGLSAQSHGMLYPANPPTNDYLSNLKNTNPYSYYTAHKVGKSYADAAKSQSSSSMQTRSNAPMSDAIVGSIGGSLTHTPQPQYMLIDNLLAGGRKYVVIDFGRTVMLTDVYLGPCYDLASITLDCWIKGEAIDSLRVTTSLDVASEPLVLTDIQPPLFCRYLKIKVIGRYGMPTHGQSKVLLPINTFYGHSLDYEYETISRDSKFRCIGELQEKHLKTLSIIHEDLLCRYSLAANHLKSLLKSHSVSLASNSAEEKRFVADVCSNCRVLQRQLNVVSRVIERIKAQYVANEPFTVNSLSQKEEDPETPSLSAANSTQISHSTRFILICMLEIARQNQASMVIQTSSCSITEEQCRYFFGEICIKGLPNNGVLALTVLHAVCHSQSWWPNFLSSSFLQYFQESTSPEMLLHIVKVFLTLLYLAKQDGLINHVMMSFMSLLLNGTAHSNRPIVPPVNNALLTSETNEAHMTSSSINDIPTSTPNCNWSQLSAILMIMSQAMSDCPTVPRKLSSSKSSNSFAKDLPSRWDFFPSILKADFLADKLNTVPQDKGRMGSSSKKDKRSKCAAAYGMARATAMKKSSVCGSKDKPGTFSGRSENEKEKHMGVKKRCDVQLPVVITHELITRLLCILPEVIRSHSSDLVVLLCRQISLLVLACDTKPDSPPISLAQLFPGNLLSQILLNAFVVTSNQLTTYAVQSLLSDLIEAEVRDVLTNRTTEISADSCSMEHEIDSDRLYRRKDMTGSRQLIQVNKKQSTNQQTEESDLPSTSSGSLGSAISYMGPTKCPLSTPLAPLHEDFTMEMMATDMQELFPSSNPVAFVTSGISLESLLSDETAALDCKSDEVIQELLKMDNLYSPVFGQSQHYVKKGCAIGKPKGDEVGPKEQGNGERSGDCLDVRLESGILHHSERWLNQLQASFSKCVHKNLACLNFSSNVNNSERKLSSQAMPTEVEFQKSNVTRATITFEDTKKLLQAVFNDLLSPRNLPYLDLKELLLCWYRVNSVRRMNSDGFHEMREPMQMIIGMSSDNMAQIFNKLTVESISDSVVWNLLFQCLIMYASSSVNYGMTTENRVQQSAPSILIRNLIHYPVLDTFLSGSWSPGGIRSEQCRGPGVTETFGLFLEELTGRNEDKHLLDQLLMKLLKSLCEFSGAIKQGYGPVDCQIELASTMFNSSCQTHDPKLICSLVNVICKLGYDYISSYKTSVTMTAQSNASKFVNYPPNVCITAFESQENKLAGVKKLAADQNGRETLLKHLFKLAQKLVSSKVNPSQLSNISGDSTVADFIICDDQLPVVNTLLITLSSCSLPCAPEQLAGGGGSSFMQIDSWLEEFRTNEADFEEKTLGDHILKLLFCIENHAHERKVLHQRLVHSLNSSVAFPSTLSQPVLFFLLYLLKSFEEVHMFASVGGVQVLVNKIVRNSETGPGFNFSMQPLHVLQKLTQCFEIDVLDLDLTDMPKNIGPKASISCSSDPTAQLPDVLLQENPPHKRARAAAWTYHFPANDVPGYCSLSITLPHLSVLHYVEVRVQVPAMGVSHNMPSSISMDIVPSRNRLAEPASCSTPPLIIGRAAGGNSSFIQLRPHEPQLCGSLLLRIYHPPDANSIGLSHIAIYAKPVLSDLSQARGFADHLITSLHAFKLIEHCLETQVQTLSKRRQTAFPTASSTELLNVPSILSEGLDAPTRDRLLSSCLSLLSQPTAQHFFMSLKKTVLCLATTSVPESVASDHGNLQQMSGQLQSEEQQAETVQHVIVFLLNSFVNGTESLTDVYVDEVLDLLYSLCTQGDNRRILLNRMSVLVSWLEANLATISESPRISLVSVAHLIHAISAILWQLHSVFSASLGASNPMPMVVTAQNFTNICQHVLNSGLISENNISASTVLKNSFDWLLCSYTHMHPSFLKTLLRLLGCRDLQTQDLNSTTGGPMSPPSPVPSFSASGVVVNDDAKQQKSFLAKQWWANLGRSHLATLHHCLLDTRVLDVFRNFAPVADMFSLLIDLSLADESKSSSANEDSTCEQTNMKTLIRLLEFLTNISENNPRAKRWLGQAEKTRFWSPLLTSLCYDQSRQHSLNLTEAALRFFETVADDNTNNQRNLAEIVSQLISQKKDALNSFVKQLILNVFLKEERVLVVIKSPKEKLMKWSSGFDLPAMGHPKYGIGHHVVYGKIDAESTIESLVLEIVDQNKLKSDSPVIVSDPASSTSKQDTASTSSNTTNYTVLSKSKMKSSKVPASQKLCKIEQKKKMLEKIFSGKSSPGLVKHLAKHPTAYWASKLKTPQKLTDEPGASVSVVQSASIVSVSKLWRCIHKTLGNDWLPNNLTFRQLLNCLKQVQSRDVEEGFIKLNLVGISSQQYDEMDVAIAESLDAMSDSPLNSQYSHVPRPPQVFASVGGFTKLALRIPVLNPDFVKLMCAHGKESSGGNNVTPTSRDLAALGFPNSDQLDLSDWVLVDPHALGGNASAAGKHVGGFGYNNVIDVETSDEENYPLDWVDEMGSGAGASGSSGASNSNANTTGIAVVAPHCLALLGLTLQLPLYVEVLLREERKARFLLRILLGVSDIGDSTTSILSTPEAKNLSTLPLEALRSLFDEYPVNTELGLVIRQQCVDAQILDLLFGCLAVLTHRNPNSVDVKSYQFLFPPTLFGCPPSTNAPKQSNKYYVSAADGSMKQQPQYWAKGTGFGTGSMQSGWNMEQSFLRRNFEEQNCCAILQVLAAFIAGTEKSSRDSSGKTLRDAEKPGTSSSANFMTGPSDCQNSESMAVDMSNFSCRLHDLISQSCLLEVLNSYLNNDSVLDISRHVAVYQAVLDVIRSMVTHRETSNQLFHLLEDFRVDSNLKAIRSCVYNYTNQLSKNLKFIPQSEKSSAEAEETEGINRLSNQLDSVHSMVEESRKSYMDMKHWQAMESRTGVDSSDNAASIADNPEDSTETNLQKEPIKTPEELYCKVMKNLQFLSYKMIKESGKNLTFNVAYHFLSEARLASDSLNTKRAKRLAQESVTLSSSLPLDYSSSVFLRYDEERLDVMKVLITGPVDTPYENGCFVFDIFFPADYPNSPLLCNFATTGVGTVRFNPNLYNDGKVCLSILNTWHGRPEEKWNSQTSNLLQVLVSIQSLILVAEPYFNEPGYERSRNTPAGQQSSNEYSANIKQATVKWAMLNQLKNPCPSFKDVIQAHFYLKKEKILKQVNSWLALMELMDKNKRYGKKLSNHVASLKKSYTALAEELNKLEAPDSIDEETKNAILRTNASSKQVSFSDANTVFESTNGQPGSSLPTNYVKSLFDDPKSGIAGSEGKCSTSATVSDFNPGSLMCGPNGISEIEVLEELKECPQSPDQTDSPTSKAATDLLNSVLDVVFWSPTVSSSITGAPADLENVSSTSIAAPEEEVVASQSFMEFQPSVEATVELSTSHMSVDETHDNTEISEEVSTNQNEAIMVESSNNQDASYVTQGPMDEGKNKTG